MSIPTSIYVESGARRVFACVQDWPGWCRSGKSEELAIAALRESAPRYAVVARDAGFEPPNAGFEVVERLPGTGTTDFGAPDARSTRDWEPMDEEEGRRLGALVEASWRTLDRMVEGAPAELPKGPRGGGRDRDQIVDHVLEAEGAYARGMGIRLPTPSLKQPERIGPLREAIVQWLGKAWDGGKPTGKKGWPPRYAARRIAWHVLDHAWEIEDKSTLRSN